MIEETLVQQRPGSDGEEDRSNEQTAGSVEVEKFEEAGLNSAGNQHQEQSNVIRPSSPIDSSTLHDATSEERVPLREEPIAGSNEESPTISTHDPSSEHSSSQPPLPSLQDLSIPPLPEETKLVDREEMSIEKQEEEIVSASVQNMDAFTDPPPVEEFARGDESSSSKNPVPVLHDNSNGPSSARERRTLPDEGIDSSIATGVHSRFTSKDSPSVSLSKEKSHSASSSIELDEETYHQLRLKMQMLERKCHELEKQLNETLVINARIQAERPIPTDKDKAALELEVMRLSSLLQEKEDFIALAREKEKQRDKKRLKKSPAKKDSNSFLAVSVSHSHQESTSGDEFVNGDDQAVGHLQLENGSLRERIKELEEIAAHLRKELLEIPNLQAEISKKNMEIESLEKRARHASSFSEHIDRLEAEILLKNATIESLNKQLNESELSMQRFQLETEEESHVVSLLRSHISAMEDKMLEFRRRMMHSAASEKKALVEKLSMAQSENDELRKSLEQCLEQSRMTQQIILDRDQILSEKLELEVERDIWFARAKQVSAIVDELSQAVYGNTSSRHRLGPGRVRPVSATSSLGKKFSNAQKSILSSTILSLLEPPSWTELDESGGIVNNNVIDSSDQKSEDFSYSGGQHSGRQDRGVAEYDVWRDENELLDIDLQTPPRSTSPMYDVHRGETRESRSRSSERLNSSDLGESSHLNQQSKQIPNVARRIVRPPRDVTDKDMEEFMESQNVAFANLLRLRQHLISRQADMRDRLSQIDAGLNHLFLEKEEVVREFEALKKREASYEHVLSNLNGKTMLLQSKKNNLQIELKHLSKDLIKINKEREELQTALQQHGYAVRSSGKHASHSSQPLNQSGLKKNTRPESSSGRKRAISAGSSSSRRS